MFRGESVRGQRERISGFFSGRRVAITGAAGTVGRELVAQLLALDVAELRGLDNDENGLFELDKAFGHYSQFNGLLCDVSSSHAVKHVFDGVDYVFHAAALKHVPICERSPSASIDVNIRGVENVVEAALEKRVSRVVFTSSDKAVHPTNVMGASKLLGERLALSANRRNGVTLVACTRFGNVAGSRGSVLPLFREQIIKHGRLTLTSPAMTRFFMTRALAVRLVIESMTHARGGEVFIPKMRAVAITDLATVMVRLLAPLGGRLAEEVQIDVTGPRPGEKLYEELLSEDEADRAISVGEYLIVPSQPGKGRCEAVTYPGLGTQTRPRQSYASNRETALTHAEIEAFLKDNALLPELGQQPLLRLVAAA
jgi:FlaA1/EpsC-like NDP-sugar epimerase